MSERAVSCSASPFWLGGALIAVGALLPLAAFALNSSEAVALEKLGLAFGVAAYFGSFLLVGLGAVLMLGALIGCAWSKSDE